LFIANEPPSNTNILIQHGKVRSYHKQYLPNYGVFDEKRYFASGQTPLVFESIIDASRVCVVA
jgi:predicted amidohydrolase